MAITNMTQQEFLDLTSASWKDVINSTVNDFNSKEQFLKYAQSSTKLMLWRDMPKLYDEQENEVKFNFNANQKLAFDKLESYCFNYGAAALSKDWDVAIVENPFRDVLVVNNELIFLRVKRTLINQRIITIETYTKIGNVYYFEYSIDKAWMLENKKADKAVKEIFGYKDKTGIVPILPYVVFINDSTFEPEINKVTPKLFNALDNVWSVLSLDAFWSAPWLFANNTKNNILQIKHGLANLKERVISTNQVLDQFSQSPINLVQGNSQASSLIQSSNYLVNLIKKFAFMKQDTSSMGTKNIHSAEAQEINSDFESAITSKANLRELQLLEFFNSFYKELNVAKVVVNSSTQWLLTEAKKYSVNLNGSLINQAALQQEIANDNDINEDTNGVENGINKS